MKTLACLFVKSPVRDWVWLFIAVNMLVTISGSVNPASRWATMMSMIEDHAFSIDNYVGTTCDWAQPPNRHYYSNKAPGPMLLGYPILRALDKMDTGDLPDRTDRDNRRRREIDHNLHILSMLTQVIPLAIATLLLINELRKLAVPIAALHLAAVAMLFGNTASLFANSYFGHAMSATLVLLTLYAVQRRMAVLTGLFYGLAVLSDYSCLLLALPLFIALTMTRQLQWRRIRGIVGGGVVPAVAFAIYHKLCFGSPFTLGQKYVNPAFVDVKSEPALWGVFRIHPDMRIIEKLIYSPERGVAYTQGWVLVCLLIALVVVWLRSSDLAQRYTLRWLTGFTIPGFILILWMNSSFGGWHGGLTCGPRYLSAILPVFALLLPLLYARVPSRLKELIIVSLVPSLVLYVLVQSSKNVLAPETPLLEYYFNQLFKPQPGDQLFNVLLILLGTGWAGYRAHKSIVRARIEPEAL